MNEFSPLEAFEQAIARWWLVAIIAICGGLIGLVFDRLNPPRYEADVLYSVNVNFSQTGNLDQFEEDLTINAAGALIHSTAVMEQVAAQARAQGIQVDVPTLDANYIFEREESSFTLRYQDADPQKAAAIVNLWGEAGLNQLKQAYEHALKAFSLQRNIDQMETCLQRSVSVEPVYGGCDLNSLQQIQVEMQKENSSLGQEMAASKGVIPALQFDLVQKATVPSRPVVYDRNQLVLAGTLIGLLLGVWAANVRFPWEKVRAPGHA